MLCLKTLTCAEISCEVTLGSLQCHKNFFSESIQNDHPCPVETVHATTIKRY